MNERVSSIGLLARELQKVALLDRLSVRFRLVKQVSALSW